MIHQRINILSKYNIYMRKTPDREIKAGEDRHIPYS
jgi:hypothetical protein